MERKVRGGGWVEEGVGGEGGKWGGGERMSVVNDGRTPSMRFSYIRLVDSPPPPPLSGRSRLLVDCVGV